MARAVSNENYLLLGDIECSSPIGRHCSVAQLGVFTFIHSLHHVVQHSTLDLNYNKSMHLNAHMLQQTGRPL